MVTLLQDLAQGFLSPLVKPVDYPWGRYLLHVKVHQANEHDTKAGCKVIDETLDRYATLLGFCADEGYRKTCKEHVENVLQKIFDISKKIKDEWAVIPKRWFFRKSLHQVFKLRATLFIKTLQDYIRL